MSPIRQLRVMLFAIVLCCLYSGYCIAQTIEADSFGPQPVSAEIVLDWIERYRRISSENAELLRQSLDRQADPNARLELALLELHAPLSPSAEERGLERLDVLIQVLNESESADWITPTAARWLLQWQSQMQTMHTLKQKTENYAARLERERRAHLATLEKLDALRSIERDLEQRSAVEEPPPAEPESTEDEPDEPSQ